MLIRAARSRICVEKFGEFQLDFLSNLNLLGICMHALSCVVAKFCIRACHAKTTSELVLIAGLGQGALNQGPVGPLVNTQVSEILKNNF